MHREILKKEQKELLPFFSQYLKKYYLVGGTAIALQLGHRTSIDFDLFIFGRINSNAIKKQIACSGFEHHLLLEKSDQIHYIMNQVKVTFFEFPFKIQAPVTFDQYFKMPDLMTLAAMKAFALGNRGKWKDYVDLYFIIKNYFGIKEISVCAKEIFTGGFNPTLFVKQLCYFDDINYDEQVEIMPGFEVSDDEVKEFLVEACLTGF